MLSGVCHRASLPSNATPRMLGSLTLATCRCRAATEIYLLTYLLTGAKSQRVARTEPAAARGLPLPNAERRRGPNGQGHVSPGPAPRRGLMRHLHHIRSAATQGSIEGPRAQNQNFLMCPRSRALAQSSPRRGRPAAYYPYYPLSFIPSPHPRSTLE